MFDLRRHRLNRPQHGPAVSRTAWARLYAQAEGQRYSGQVAPRHGADTVPKYETVETVLRLTPGSSLVSIATFSAQAAGFRFNVYDSTGRALFVTPVHCDQIGSPVDATIAARQQYWLPAPWIVPPPGALTVRIANLAAAANALQVYLVFAEPMAAGRKP